MTCTFVPDINSDSTKDNSPSTETQLKIYADHLETQIVSLKTERDLLNDELRAAEKNIKSLTEKNNKQIRWIHKQPWGAFRSVSCRQINLSFQHF